MTGMGNITTAAEFNFYADPESAHVVLKRMQKIGTVKTKLVTWELCRQSTFLWVILTLSAHFFGCKNINFFCCLAQLPLTNRCNAILVVLFLLATKFSSPLF